jgi:hypothetical protein
MQLTRAVNGLFDSLRAAAAGLPHLDRQLAEEDLMSEAWVSPSNVQGMVAALQQAQLHFGQLQGAYVASLESLRDLLRQQNEECHRSTSLRIHADMQRKRAEFAEAQLAALLGAGQQPGAHGAAGASVGAPPAAAATDAAPAAALPLYNLHEDAQDEQVRTCKEPSEQHPAQECPKV